MFNKSPPTKPLASDSDVQALADAFHRKLLAYGEDIRKASRVPSNQRDMARLRQLKKDRRHVDQGYSSCLKILKNPDHADRQVLFFAMKLMYSLT